MELPDPIMHIPHSHGSETINDKDEEEGSDKIDDDSEDDVENIRAALWCGRKSVEVKTASPIAVSSKKAKN